MPQCRERWLMQLAQKRQLSVYILLIFVLLFALGLRLYRIDGQSLWNDEGTSIALAKRNLAAITWGAANDIHPPLYYYILHFWMVLFGDSELAARSLSALLGTALVLLTFALGRCLAGNVLSLLAAFFAALSPFQVYYSQEARMYVLSAFLGALSMALLLHLLSASVQETAEAVTTNPTQRHCVRYYLLLGSYILVTGLLLYSHYFAATMIIVHNLVFLWWLFTSRPAGRDVNSPAGLLASRLGLLLRWVALQTIIAIVYLPWLLLVARQLGIWPAISEPLQVTTLAFDLLRVFSLGLSVAPRFSPLLIGFAALLLVGIVAPLLPLRHGHKKDSATNFAPYIACLLYLFLPTGILYALSLRRPMYNPKFLLLCTPPFHLFLAQGALWLGNMKDTVWQIKSPDTMADKGTGSIWRWRHFLISLVSVAFIVGASCHSLWAYYFDPRYARDNYRGIAQYIQAIESEGDAVLINAPGQIETFAYYYQGSLPLYPLPRQRPLDEAETEADLKQLTEGRRRIFAVLWATDESDPGRFVEGWLDQYTYKAMDSWYGNVRLVIYAVPVQPSTGNIMYPLNVTLGGKVRLLGYNLPMAQVRPGDILQLTLFWQATAPINERYKVFTHIVDAHGHLVGQRDAEPGGGAKITTTWKAGEQIVDNYGLPVLPATPPGDCAIEIGMYGLDNGQRLPVMDGERVVGDRILLQSVYILPAATPPPLSVLGMKKQLNVQFEDITLLGYDLTKLGYEHQPDALIHAGDIVHLTLFWQAQRRPQTDIALLLQVRDDKGTIRLQQQTLPTAGQYPAEQWLANEIVRDQHHLVLPADLPVGRYHLQLCVQHLPGNQQIGKALTIASLTIR